MEQFVQNSRMYNDMRSGKFQYSAFVDPNDPSKVFLEQPKQYWSISKLIDLKIIISHNIKISSQRPIIEEDIFKSRNNHFEEPPAALYMI